jgi:hypothetical protein
MFLLKLNPIEPPWYGPVCPVVWEGRRREASPYPNLRRIGDNGAPDWERSPSISPTPDKPRLQAAEPRSRNNWGLPTKF